MTPDGPRVTLSQNDWSLHRKGPIDLRRHNDKVKEAIKGDLGGIIADEAIITSDGKKIIRVPVRGLELPRFRFKPNSGKNQAGQGEGGSKVGDVLGQGPGQGVGPGKGKEAGGTPGIDYYEAEITVDEIAALLFQDLGLPNLEQKRQEMIPDVETVVKGVRRSGPMSRLHLIRSAKEALKRKAVAGQPVNLKGGFQNEDLRFKDFEDVETPRDNAVLIAMRDVSGSMGEFEKYITRSSYFWMLRFLRTKYQRVEMVFLTHTTEAKEVDEEAFFQLGESGGTKVSSVYQKAVEIADERYPVSNWNTYPFHFTDGDNWGEVDNQRCVETMGELLKRSQQAGYAEISQGGPKQTSLRASLSRIKDPKLVIATIGRKEDVYPTLQAFFNPKRAA